VGGVFVVPRPILSESLLLRGDEGGSCLACKVSMTPPPQYINVLYQSDQPGGGVVDDKKIRSDDSPVGV